jgi:HEAT repeat protein
MDGPQTNVPVLVEALHDRAEGVRSQAASALVSIGPRALPAVAPLLNATEPSVRHEALRIFRTIAAERVDSGVSVGWPAELHRLISAYDDDMSRAERARLTRAVVSMVREYPNEIGK